MDRKKRSDIEEKKAALTAYANEARRKRTSASAPSA